MGILKKIWDFFNAPGDYACDPDYKIAYEKFLERRRQEKNEFLMQIDNVIQIYGVGTVICGTLKTDVKVGDEVEIYSEFYGPIKATIIGIERFNETFRSGSAGLDCGLLFRNIKPFSKIAKGDPIFLKGTYS
jgi:translation elongation factor EF-Tu-like GTPase